MLRPGGAPGSRSLDFPGGGSAIEANQRGERLQAAAFRAAEPVLDALHTLAECDVPELRNAALASLAAFQHPTSLRFLKAASRIPRSRDAARDALVRFGGPAALEILVDLIEESGDPPFRHETVRRLSAFAGTDVLRVLAKAAQSEDPGSREAAARALGAHPGPEVEAALVALLEDPKKEVSVAALLALRDVGTDRSVVPLLRILHDSRDVFVRSTAIMTLGRLAPAEAKAAVRKLLKDPDDRIRASAIEALGRNLRDHLDDVPLVAEALRDESNRVRGNAIVGLYEVDPTACLKPFSDLYLSPRKFWRSTAAWVLGQVQSPELFQAYMPVLNTESDKDVVAMSLRSIEECSSPRLVPTMGKLLGHPNAEVRMRASIAFARMARPSDRPLLLGALTRERDPRVKAGMLPPLGKLSDATNFADIFPFLDDPDPRVVANAIEALGRVGDLAVAPVLRDTLGARPPRVRANALVALVRVGDLTVLPKLADMLRSPLPDEVKSGAHAAEILAADLHAARQGDPGLAALGAALSAAAESVSDDELVKALDVDAAGDESTEGELVWAKSLSLEPDEPLDLSREEAGADPLARYREATRTGAPVGDREREVFRNRRFMPGLFLALEQDRKAGAPARVQASYLDLADAQLSVLGQFLRRAQQRVRDGAEAQVYRMLEFFFRQIKLNPEVHKVFGQHYLAQKEYDLAYEHLIEAFAADPDDLELLVQAAGAAIRIRKIKVARELLAYAAPRVAGDPRLKSRVSGLAALVESPSRGS